jgi:hypothetical protein
MPRTRPAAEELEARALPSLLPAVPYDTPAYPYAVTVGDFNGDGRPDLAAIDSGEDYSTTTGGVSVLLGNGDGTFGAPRLFPAGQFPQSLAAGDLDGDGDLDLVVTNYAGGDLSVLRGNGDGTFLPPVNYDTLVYPLALVLADLDRDGDLDVVAGGLFGTSVLLNHGDGTLGAAQVVEPGSNLTRSLAAADFNGDGNPDIAAMELDCFPDGSTNCARVWLGDGGGGLTLSFAYAPAWVLSAVAAGDFDGDGHPDLAVSGWDSSSPFVAVLLGDRDGTFREAAPHRPGVSPIFVMAADLNVDGATDLVIAEYGGEAVGVSLGNGDGTFRRAGTHRVADSPYWAAAGFFDGDSYPDLAVASVYGVGGVLSVLINDGEWGGALVPPWVGALLPCSGRGLASPQLAAQPGGEPGQCLHEAGGVVPRRPTPRLSADAARDPVRDEHRQLIPYLLVWEPFPRCDLTMTRSNRMPVLVGERI